MKLLFYLISFCFVSFNMANSQSLNKNIDIESEFLKCNINFKSSTNKYNKLFNHCYKDCYQTKTYKNSLNIPRYIQSSSRVIKNNFKTYHFLDWNNNKIKKEVSVFNLRANFIQWKEINKKKCSSVTWRAVVRLKKLDPVLRSEQIWSIVDSILKSKLRPSWGKMEVPGKERVDSIIFQYCATEGRAIIDLAKSLNKILLLNNMGQFLEKKLPAFLLKNEFIGLADYEGVPGHSHGAVLCHYISKKLANNSNVDSKYLSSMLYNIGYGQSRAISLPHCWPKSKNEFCNKCENDSICSVLKESCKVCKKL